MQTPRAALEQTPPRGKNYRNQVAPPHAFKPGNSGNASGKTRAQRRTEEFIEQYKLVRGQNPSATDLATLRAAGRTCARLEGRGLTPDQIAKLSNTLRRDLRRLKLEVQDNAQEQPSSDRYTGPKRRASTIKRDTE